MPNIRKTFNFRDGVQVDDTVLVVKGDRVGIGTTVPEKSLDVRGNAQVVGIITADNSIISGVGTFGGVKLGSAITLDATSGVITATSFKGDGGTLSNLPTSQWQNVNQAGGVTSIYNTGGNVGIMTNDPRSGLQIGGQVNATPQQSGVGISSLGHIKATGIVTALGGFSGELTGNVIGNVTGTASNATLAATATVATNAQNLTGTPDITVRNINSAGISTLTTLNSTDFTVPTLKGYSTLRGIHGSTLTLTVTVAAKTTAHRYNGQGGSNAFLIDGVQAPFLTLTPGRTYRFDLSDGTTATHPFKFYYDADRTTEYTTGVTVVGTQGSAGAYREILVSDTTPTVLHYACQTHALMGNGIQTNSNVLDTEHNSTVRGTMTATSFVGNLTGNVTGNQSGGSISATSGTFSGDIDVDGHAELDQLNVSGITTSSSFVGPLTGNVTGNLTGNVTGNLTATTSMIGLSTGVSLGIGTATANSEIQIVDSGASSLVIGKGGAVGVNNLELRYGGGASRFSTANALDLINHGDGHFNYFLTGNNSFVWHKGNSNELMTLTNTGNLGIGVTNPTDRFVVQGNSKFTGVTTFTGSVTMSNALTVPILNIADISANLVGNVNSTGISTFRQMNIKGAPTSGIGVHMDANGQSISVGPSVLNRFFVGAGTSMGCVGIGTDILTPYAGSGTSGAVFPKVEVRGEVKIHNGGVRVGGLSTTANSPSRAAIDFSNVIATEDNGTSLAPLGYMIVPRGTTAQRNALRDGTNNSATLMTGSMYYDTDLNKLCVYDNGGWKGVTLGSL